MMSTHKANKNVKTITCHSDVDTIAYFVRANNEQYDIPIFSGLRVIRFQVC